MLTVSQYLKAIKLLLPRHLVATNIGDEEIVDVVNYERHRVAAVLANSLPWWSAGITRGDVLSTGTRTRAESNVRRWDGNNFTALVWQELQFPEWFYAIQAVNILRDKKWYPVRILPVRGAWDIAARTWLTATPFSPIAVTWSDSANEAVHWLGVSLGTRLPSKQELEVWYLKMPGYVEIGDPDTDMPDWTYGIIVFGVLLSLLAKHNKNQGVEVQIVTALRDQFYNVLSQFVGMITVRLLRQSSVAYSVKQSNLMQVQI
jgi:hypothetical protein